MAMLDCINDVRTGPALRNSTNPIREACCNPRSAKHNPKHSGEHNCRQDGDAMPTYLATWNPKRSEWDEHGKVVTETLAAKYLSSAGARAIEKM